MFRKLLIANRGEIAVRIIRTCRELGIATVAVHSTADENALHTRLADEAVCIGPPHPLQSYLNIPAILSAAEITQAEAVHPGYGFLAENHSFAALCETCGLQFVGPTAAMIQQWGDKVQARQLAKRLGLPITEGSGALDHVDEATHQANAIGYPLMLKATAGGGGRGMHIVHNEQELLRVFAKAQHEAEASFGCGALYLERYIQEPRHIEFQVLADGLGHVWVLGERECSIQRRHQKLLEETPSPAVSTELRDDMTQTIQRAFSDHPYRSLGTLEFLMDERGHLTFMEMNPRIQVEHPVTEMVFGVDLVAEQIRIAAGEPVHLPSHISSISSASSISSISSWTPRGHAIECRINAEDPLTFAPWPGTITEYHPPGGVGVRVDTGIYGGWTVPSTYDSMLVKMIVHGRNRREACARMQRALGETWIGGIRTNIALHQRILADPDFQQGKLSTQFLERLLR